MNPKKIILCPNPNRDHGMKTTKAAEKILHDLGFQTVVCSPFKDQKDELFAGYQVRSLPQELKSADLLITLGGDGTILHLAKLAALNRMPMLGINMGGLGFVAELEAGELESLRKLKNWDFETEHRMMLDVCVLRDGKQIYTNMGLNDAVIREGPISHVIHLKTFSRYCRGWGDYLNAHRLNSLFSLRWWSGGRASSADHGGLSHLHPQHALFCLCALSRACIDRRTRAQWTKASIPVCG